jgi:hypothetical protein
MVQPLASCETSVLGVPEAQFDLKMIQVLFWSRVGGLSWSYHVGGMRGHGSRKYCSCGCLAMTQVLMGIAWFPRRNWLLPQVHCWVWRGSLATDRTLKERSILMV